MRRSQTCARARGGLTATLLRLSSHAPSNAPPTPTSPTSSNRAEKLTEMTSTLARFPIVPPKRAVSISLNERIGASLLSQRYIKRDSVRGRHFALCTRCGHTTVTIGFDTTPSARLGMMGRCLDSDYSHHTFVPIAENDYHQLRPMRLDERLTWFAFHR